MKIQIICSIVLLLSVAVQAQEKVPIKIDYPKVSHIHSDSGASGARRSIRDYQELDSYPNYEPRPPILVPVGCDKLLSRGCKVTSSEDDKGGPIIGKLEDITDGIKECNHDVMYVELGPRPQWIQIDLGEEKEIHAICIWHYHCLFSSYSSFRFGRIYRDVICQISNDPKFIDGVVTVFNNDHDNSTGIGVGKDLEYIESRFGRPFAVDAVKGRYVRCYSRGNTDNAMNHYLEVEVFGRHIERKQKAEADNAEVRRKKAEQ